MDRKILVEELKRKSSEIRLALLEMFSYGKAHHFGGSFSCVELLATLYFYKMNYTKKNWNSPIHDRLIMSKGHSVPTQYVCLSMLGILPYEELNTIKTLGSRLQGHPDMVKTPGIEAPTGSLGQGLSFANGIALAAEMDGLSFNIYVIMGDGEMQEGQVWEAAMSTSHFGLTNICVLIDSNRHQSQGEVDRSMRISPLDKKWESFGWNVVEVDGHDIEQICDALDIVGKQNDKPYAIIAKTVKGKGISFIEDTHKYHNLSLTEEEYWRAKEQLLGEQKQVRKV